MIQEQDFIELLYQDRSGPVSVESGVMDTYLAGCSDLGIEPRFSPELLPADPHLHWLMPERYQTLDLDRHFAGLVSSDEEIERVALELKLFRENGLEPMLRFMIHMVDIMREKQILWGVGRGSSVSSYLLFLIGLHSVDAIKYSLDIREFIK